jgi:hypothetical protein
LHRLGSSGRFYISRIDQEGFLHQEDFALAGIAQKNFTSAGIAQEYIASAGIAQKGFPSAGQICISRDSLGYFCISGIVSEVLYFIQQRLICRPSDFTVSEDAGIGSRTVATLALAVRCSNHSAISHSC